MPKRKAAKRSSTGQMSIRKNKTDTVLGNLLRNGRDYSYTNPVTEAARKARVRRSKEEQDEKNLKERPWIIYTPMGGTNKKY